MVPENTKAILGCIGPFSYDFFRMVFVIFLVLGKGCVILNVAIPEPTISLFPYHQYNITISISSV